MQKVKCITSYENALERVSEVRERRIFNGNIMEHYRGQGRPEYKLLPNISRKASNAQEVKARESSLVKEFKEYLKKEKIEGTLYIDNDLNDGQNLWNVLIQMQHLGIPTRFLDWSLKWEVGLWFAVENPANDNVDGQLWIFSVPNEMHPTDTRDNFYNKNLSNLDKTYLINVPIYWSENLKDQLGEIKRQRQYGKFSVSSFERSLVPLEEQVETAIYLEKYCIPAVAKKQIRLKLSSLGVHKEWLYYREGNTEIQKKLENFVDKTTP